MKYRVIVKRSTSQIEIICFDWEKVQNIINTVFSEIDNDASISVEMIKEEKTDDLSSLRSENKNS